jgi:hypothetical protein
MTILPPSALVLVVIMNRLRDLEIARLLGWYRIPLRTAPKVIAVDYLAFYQTEAFGADKWRIQYLAPVRGHELTTRGELLKDELDHPRANEEYFKIQLGPLLELESPILAEKWRRITFLYTTGEYILKASTITDLVVHSEERNTLWLSLRERASQSQVYDPDLPDIDIDPKILALILGVSELEGNYHISRGNSD